MPGDIPACHMYPYPAGRDAGFPPVDLDPTSERGWATSASVAPSASAPAGAADGAPLTWGRAQQLGKDVNGWLETAGTHLAHPLLVACPRLTPWFDRFAAGSMRAGAEVMRQSDNMLLGPWINYMVPSLNASVSLPPGPDCRELRTAWTMAVDLVERAGARGRYPANLAMNARLFGRSAALLHSLPGDDSPTVANIQITSFANRHWEGFKDRLMARWLTIPGARPHWAKQYQDLPRIAATLRRVYGGHLEAFLQIRQEEGIDPDDVFFNPFLRELFFGAV